MSVTVDLPRRQAVAVDRTQRRRRPGLVPTVPLAILGMVTLVAIFAPMLTPYDPVRQDLRNILQPPAWVGDGSWAHPLGTDGSGRDVLTRLFHGARVSLLVAGLSLAIAVLVGASVGLIAGYARGSVDSILMRFVDGMMALPDLIVALVLAALVGPSFINLVLILGFLNWPRIARLVRGETLTLTNVEFVRYSRAIGVSNRVILLRHVLPNVAPTLLVATTLEVGGVILAEASLSFLGAGLPAPQASWGVMIADGRALIASGWWIALFPGLAITTTILSLNIIGDWLRDYFDPRTRHA